MQLTKILLDYHRRMLGDDLRTEAFRRTIAAVVRPGDVVVDVGTGTGVLACFACAAGARRVYAIESGQIMEAARAVVAENGFADRVSFVARDSRRARLPERADVVVSETLGSLGVEENLVELLADARRRFLKPGGRLIPSRVQTFAAPVGLEEEYARLTWPSGERHGLRFGLLRHLFVNTPYRLPVPAAALLGPPRLLYDLDLGSAERLPDQAEVELPLAREGLCHGVVAWFAAFAGEVELIATGPDRPLTHWEQLFLPVEHPAPAQTGGRLAFRLRAFPTRNEVLFEWSGRFLPPGGGEEQPGSFFLQSNLHLVSPWQGVDLRAKEAIAAGLRRGPLTKLLQKPGSQAGI